MLSGFIMLQFLYHTKNVKNRFLCRSHHMKSLHELDANVHFVNIAVEFRCSQRKMKTDRRPHDDLKRKVTDICECPQSPTI